MELSCSNSKKILIFSLKKAFLIFLEMEPCTFQPKLEKQKNPPWENFLYLRSQSTLKIESFKSNFFLVHSVPIRLK